MSIKFTYVDDSFPELAKNFKDQSKTHVTKSCKDVVTLICPCCKKEFQSRVVDYIKAGHVPCLLCNDGFPYTEKFMGSILRQLNIHYIYQYSPKWIKPYKYDFKFNYNHIDYIVEMDGGLGHGYHDSFDKTAQECIEIDNYKDKKAKDNNIVVIRIDCNYENNNRFVYIKNNVIKELSNILPLKNVDWNLCNLQSIKSKFEEVIDIYKTKTNCLEDISELTDVKLRTVIKYIYEAMDSGLIPKKRLNIKRYKQCNRKPITDPKIINPTQATNNSIYCYEDTLLFRSVTDAALYYGFSRASLYVALREYNGYYKGRHFVKYKDLSSDFNYKRIIFPEESYAESKKILCQYTLDDKLIHIYIRKEELPNNMYWNNIWRSCVNQRKSAYGYKWKFLDKKDEFDIFEMIRANSFARFYFAN